MRLWPEYEKELKQLFNEAGMSVIFDLKTYRKTNFGFDCISHSSYDCILLYILENGTKRRGTIDDVLKVTPGSRSLAKDRLLHLAMRKNSPFARLTVRAANVLRCNNISTLEELAALSINEVRRFPNCGRVTREELTQVLVKAGMSFAPTPPWGCQE